MKLSKFSFGIQTQFLYNWSQWIKTVDQPAQVSAIRVDSQLSNARDLQSNDAVVTKQTVTKCVAEELKLFKNASSFNLSDILSYGPYGPGVLSHYKLHNGLNDRTRKLLVEAFLHHCASTGASVSKADCQSIAMQIVGAFKGEILVKICL